MSQPPSFVDARSAAVEPARPIPPRLRWLKRLGTGLGLLVLLLVCVRWWWGFEVDRRMQAAINDYHRRGEPILLSDLNCPPVPDDRNAARFYRQAADSIKMTREQRGYYNNGLSKWRRWSDSDMAFMKKLLAANGPVLDLVRQARGKTAADWGVRFSAPAIGISMSHLSSMRDLSIFLSATASYEHRMGEDALALERISDMFALARALEQPPTVLVSHLQAQSICVVACSSAQVVSYDLRISPALPGAATRQQVLLLVRELLDPTPWSEGSRRAWQGERVVLRDLMDTAAGRNWLLAPAHRLDALRAMEWVDRCIAAMSQPLWPNVTASLPQMPARGVLPYSYTRSVSRMLMPSAERTTLVDYKMNVEHRATALLLAMRLYAVEHDGRRPARLQDLVPDYLPAVPVDPLSTDGRAFSYRADTDKPAIWSVGEDGRDDSGSDASRTQSPSVGVWGMKDAVYFLVRKPPATQSSETGDD